MDYENAQKGMSKIKLITITTIIHEIHRNTPQQLEDKAEYMKKRNE
jgi:hypothetical protein